MKKYGRWLLLAVLPSFVLAGGNTDFVRFPDGYKENFTLYSTHNRMNNEQVADFYANEVAVKSAKEGVFADGSILVMEIYKAEVDEQGERITGPDGVFRKAGLAAVAVMEKRSEWDAAYPVEERTGGWGYAFYDAQGTPKANDLDCVACHTPQANQDYVFTFPKLTEQ
jgi:hypothetical protein